MSFHRISHSILDPQQDNMEKSLSETDIEYQNYDADADLAMDEKSETVVVLDLDPEDDSSFNSTIPSESSEGFETVDESDGESASASESARAEAAAIEGGTPLNLERVKPTSRARRKKTEDDILKQRLKEVERRKKSKRPKDKRSGGYDTVSIQFKLAVVNKIRHAGISARTLGNLYDIRPSTISGWKNKEHKLRDEVKGGKVATKKNIKNSHWPKIDEALHTWFNQMNELGAIINTDILKAAANRSVV